MGTVVATKVDNDSVRVDEIVSLIDARVRARANALVEESSARAGFAEEIANWFLSTDFVGSLAAEIDSLYEEGHSSLLRIRGGTLSLEDVLQVLASKSATGILIVEGSGHRVELHIHRGQICYLCPVRTNLFEGQDQLYCSEVAIPGEYAEIFFDGEERSNSSFFIELIQDRVLSIDDLQRVMTSLGAEVICSAIEDPTQCEIEFLGQDQVDPGFAELAVRLPVQSFLLMLFSRVDEWKVFRSTICGHNVVYGVCEETLESKREMVRGQHQRVVAEIDGQRCAEEVAIAAKLSRFEACSALYSLQNLGVIHELSRDDGQAVDV